MTGYVGLWSWKNGHVKKITHTKPVCKFLPPLLLVTYVEFGWKAALASQPLKMGSIGICSFFSS